MSKHYNDIEDILDKIVHLLYAAKTNDIMGIAIIQIAKEYGEDITIEAIRKCKELYPYIFD